MAGAATPRTAAHPIPSLLSAAVAAAPAAGSALPASLHVDVCRPDTRRRRRVLSPRR